MELGLRQQVALMGGHTIGRPHAPWPYRCALPPALALGSAAGALQVEHSSLPLPIPTPRFITAILLYIAIKQSIPTQRLKKVPNYDSALGHAALSAGLINLSPAATGV